MDERNWKEEITDIAIKAAAEDWRVEYVVGWLLHGQQRSDLVELDPEDYSVVSHQLQDDYFIGAEDVHTVFDIAERRALGGPTHD